MIRLKKSEIIPESLLVPNCKEYDGQDVQNTLYDDQKGKCYLCEQYTQKDYQIEHHRAKAVYTTAKYAWDNLLLSCGYCNSRKSKGYKELLNPLENDVENILEQRINFEENRVEVRGSAVSEPISQTADLLKRLINGKNGLRDKKAELLYKDIEREITFFLKQVNLYKLEPSVNNKQVVIDCLDISKEFLALKYWIIKDHLDLYQTFKSYMVWNKLTPPAPPSSSTP